MGTTKLQLYKRAVLHCKQTPPTSLTENIEARRLCDVHYDDVVAWMLEGGFWRHAMRSVEITENTGVTQAFGFEYAHDVPIDFVKLHTVSSSGTFSPPLDGMDGGDAYLLEANYFWTNTTPLYLRYVSNDSQYGTDLTKWSERLSEAFSLELATRICSKLTGSGSLADSLKTEAARAIKMAGTLESLQQPTNPLRTGRWGWK